MVLEILVILLVFAIERPSLANRNRLREDAGELEFVERPVQAASIAPQLMGLSKLQPSSSCGSRLIANIIINKRIASKPFIFHDDGSVTVSSAFKDVEKYNSKVKGLVPITTGMSLHKIGVRYTSPWKNVKQVLDLINEFVEGYGAIDLEFDAGLDMRSCWGDMRDAYGQEVCGAFVIGDLARAVQSDPFEGPADAGKSVSATIRKYPRFILKSLSAQRALLAEIMPNISSGILQLEQMYGGVYATGLTPMCAVIAGADGTDWLVMRKVKIAGAKAVQVGNVPYLNLKGPTFAGMLPGKSLYDNTLWGSTFADVKTKDPGFAAMFPDGLTVSSCGGREVAFSMEKDAKLLESLAIVGFTLLIKFYKPESSTDHLCDQMNLRKRSFPLVLDVIKPARFRIAWGIIDYTEHTTRRLPEEAMKKATNYREDWMRMWPAYFRLSDMSLQEYRSELFAKRIRGCEVSKVVALTRMKWSPTRTIRTPYYKDLIDEGTASAFSFVYLANPGDLGIVDGDSEDGLLVRWDNNTHSVFWVQPQNVMPVPR